MLLILAGVLCAINVRWCDNFRDKYYSGTRTLPGLNCQDRTEQDRATKTDSQLGQLGQDWQDRVVKIGQPVRTARRGLPGQPARTGQARLQERTANKDSQNTTGRTGLSRQNSRVWTSMKGTVRRVQPRTRLPG